MMFDFDPSKMDPKTLMELSQLISQLPPEQLNKIQTLMHNMAAGFDVRAQMEELERSLPPGFREKLMAIAASAPQMSAQGTGPTPENTPAPALSSPASGSSEMDLREARMTILRAVAERAINPEEALLLLFPH